MNNFFKAVLVAAIFIWLFDLHGYLHESFHWHVHFDNDWASFDRYESDWHGVVHWLDGHWFESIIGLGVVMLSFIISLIVGALIVAALLGSLVFAGGLALLLIIGAVLFSGLFISWPVVLGVLVIWLLVRDKPRKNNSMGY